MHKPLEKLGSRAFRETIRRTADIWIKPPAGEWFTGTARPPAAARQ
jgi:hypothetical protein